jgi:hypothetical protein
MADGALCIPNISGPGRTRRRRVAAVLYGLSALSLVLLVANDASGVARAFVGAPFAGATISYLQVTRNTCIAHASAGTIEGDDFSTTRAPEDQNAASKRVARTIVRDGVLLGVVASVIAAATALLG